LFFGVFNNIIQSGKLTNNEKGELRKRVLVELKRFTTYLPLSFALGVEIGKEYITEEKAVEILKLFNEYFLMHFFFIFTIITERDKSLIQKVRAMIDDNKFMKIISSTLIESSVSMMKMGVNECEKVRIVNKTGNPQKSLFLEYLIGLCFS